MKYRHNPRLIFTNAWAYLRSGLFKTFGESLKAAWQKSKLILRLRQGLVYLAVRGESKKARLAIATMKEEHTVDYEIGLDMAKVKEEYVVFLDLIKGKFTEIRIDKIKSKQGR